MPLWQYAWIAERWNDGNINEQQTMPHNNIKPSNRHLHARMEAWCDVSSARMLRCSDAETPQTCLVAAAPTPQCVPLGLVCLVCLVL